MNFQIVIDAKGEPLTRGLMEWCQNLVACVIGTDRLHNRQWVTRTDIYRALTPQTQAQLAENDLLLHESHHEHSCDLYLPNERTPIGRIIDLGYRP